MTMIKDIYADYSKEDIGTKISIELEVAKADAQKMTKKFSTLDIKMESEKIGEILNIHTLPAESRQYIYKTIKKIYKDTFPVWSDTRLSWGVHFHAFFKETMSRSDIEGLNFKINTTQYQNNFKALPLYSKANGHTFYSRPNGQSFDMYRASLFDAMIENRSAAGGIRNSFRSHRIGYGYNDCQEGENFKSIEFRCNNITDTRIYGYYIGQLLLAEMGIVLKELSIPMPRDMSSFDEKETYKNIKELRGTTYKGEDSETIVQNLKILLMALRKNGFRESAKQLRAYAKEFAII